MCEIQCEHIAMHEVRSGGLQPSFVPWMHAHACAYLVKVGVAQASGKVYFTRTVLLYHTCYFQEETILLLFVLIDVLNMYLAHSTV